MYAAAAAVSALPEGAVPPDARRALQRQSELYSAQHRSDTAVSAHADAAELRQCVSDQEAYIQELEEQLRAAQHAASEPSVGASLPGVKKEHSRLVSRQPSAPPSTQLSAPHAELLEEEAAMAEAVLADVVASPGFAALDVPTRARIEGLLAAATPGAADPAALRARVAALNAAAEAVLRAPGAGQLPDTVHELLRHLSQTHAANAAQLGEDADRRTDEPAGAPSIVIGDLRSERS
eukprot:gene36112-8485_t